MVTGSDCNPEPVPGSIQAQQKTREPQPGKDSRGFPRSARGSGCRSAVFVVVIRTEDKPRAAFRLPWTMEKAWTAFDGHHNRNRAGRGG